MLLVVDIGNTRTKWAQVDNNDQLQEVSACTNADFAESQFKRALQNVDQVLIANVAGEAMAKRVAALIPAEIKVTFAAVKPESAGVVNHYQNISSLGIDRWSAVLAAWQLNKQPTIVVCAGTAVTIDAITKDIPTKKGIFMGGVILPGLRLMQESLHNNTAQISMTTAGEWASFPGNTKDAVETGCVNAIVGAILLMLKQLEKQSAFLPKLVIGGGDVTKIAEALKPHINRIKVDENLVLQGLILLEKEEK